MYSSLQNQIYNLIHFLFGFIILFVIYPKFIFSNAGKSNTEKLLANFIKMVFVTIVMGYILVITDLYEFIGISISLALIFYVKNFLIDKKFVFSEVLTKINVYFYDCIDNKRNIIKDVLGYIEKRRHWTRRFISENFDSKSKNISYLLLIVVIGYSAYLRFFDAVTSAVPGMSDGNVTLAWMKYIARRDLFHDGIYPQGFHIYLATIQKFAYINPLYILKYAGPFNEIMIIWGIFIFIYKLTNRAGIGVIGAAVYGILFQLLPIDWIRQSATNSQEFGFVFVLPTIYFAYRYIKNNNKDDLLTTFCGVAVLMLVHTVALSFAAIGIISLSLAALILKIKTNFKRVLFIGISSFVAIGIGLLPIGYGMLMGKGFNNSSTEFLLATTKVDYPKLTSFDYAAIVSIALMVLYFVIKIKSFSNNLFELFIVSFSVSAFFIYYAAGVLTNSSVVVTRFSELWGLVLPVSISIGIYISLIILMSNFIKCLLEIIVTIVIVTYTFMSLKPQPIIPYKMERGSRVEQYLKIDKLLRPTEWMIVSQDEDYAIILGTGYHLAVKEFLDLYDPSEEKLTRKDTREVSSIPDIFIYYEKNVFTTDFDNLKAEYQRREQEKPLIQNWVDIYQRNHDNLSKFYEDENLVVYHIHQKLDRQETFDNIWAN